MNQITRIGESIHISRILLMEIRVVKNRIASRQDGNFVK